MADVATKSTGPSAGLGGEMNTAPGWPDCPKGKRDEKTWRKCVFRTHRESLATSRASTDTKVVDLTITERVFDEQGHERLHLARTDRATPGSKTLPASAPVTARRTWDFHPNGQLKLSTSYSASASRMTSEVKAFRDDGAMTRSETQERKGSKTSPKEVITYTYNKYLQETQRSIDRGGDGTIDEVVINTWGPPSYKVGWGLKPQQYVIVRQDFDTDADGKPDRAEHQLYQLAANRRDHAHLGPVLVDNDLDGTIDKGSSDDQFVCEPAKYGSYRHPRVGKGDPIPTGKKACDCLNASTRKHCKK